MKYAARENEIILSQLRSPTISIQNDWGDTDEFQIVLHFIQNNHVIALSKSLLLKLSPLTPFICSRYHTADKRRF